MKNAIRTLISAFVLFCSIFLGGCQKDEGPTSAVQTAANPTVDTSAFIFAKQSNGHKYYVSKKMTNWKEAKIICEQYGGHLVTISSQEENDVVLQIAKKASIYSQWIGCTDEQTEGIWRWISGESFAYTNWQQGEPNNQGDEDYGAFRNDTGEWWDAGGLTTIMPFIMEIDPSSESIFLYGEEFNGHRYFVSKIMTNWSEAKIICEEYGGHLVTITSQAENDVVLRVGKKASIYSQWIGCTDEQTEGTWGWISGESFAYTNWQQGEPNNQGNEDFGAIRNDSGKWWDAGGVTTLMPFIMEMER